MINKLKKLIKKSSNIAIISHNAPDPDTVGSSLALYYAIKKMGKNVNCFCDDLMIANYSFLETNVIYNNKEFNNENFDLIIFVDVASSNLVGKFETIIDSAIYSIRIDHHIVGTLKAKLNIVENASACAIIIYDILKKLKIKFDEKISSALYFGICGDTGLFRNNSTDSKSLFVASKLVDRGANIRKIYSQFFDKKSVPMVKLTSKMLLNAELNDIYKYAILSVTKKDISDYNLENNDNFGNLPLTYINCGYKLGAVLKEKDEKIKISLRSVPEVDCSLIAEKFGGGGHKNASGCEIDSSLENAKALLKQVIEDYLKNH